MTAVLQRVESAVLTIDGEVHASIGPGLFILLGVREGDEEKDADVLAAKCGVLRIFTDENGKMNRSVADIGGEVLVVSNFTLCADCSHGRRPSFTDAMHPERAKKLYERFADNIAETLTVKTGVFGADMKITLTNDGPVTIVLESEDLVK